MIKTKAQKVLNGDYYTRQDAAQILKVSVKTVDRLIKANKLKASKKNNYYVVIMKEDLERYINKNY